MGIRTYRDLLTYLPRRYEDRRVLPSLSALEDGQTATVTGRVLSRSSTRSRRGLHVMRAYVEGASGQRFTAVWFNQPWLEKQVYPGLDLVVSGKVKLHGGRVELSVTGFEVDDDEASLSFGRIVGVYKTDQGTSQAYVRRAVMRLLEALPVLPDHLPRTWLERHELVPLDMAWRAAHFPDDEGELRDAMRRLKFDDFLFFELAVLRSRDPTRLGKSQPAAPEDLERFASVLPFELTRAQRRALDEVLADMAAPRQMARLLQRSEEHTSELQSRPHLVCRLLLEKKNKKQS